MISRATVVSLVLAGLALASGKPAWGNGPGAEGLHNHKAGDSKPSGNNDIADMNIDFDNLSPVDCASYLCVSSAPLATEYIEAGCPGQFALYEPDEADAELAEPVFAATASGSSSGVTTGTLLSLASASGVFAAGVGFLAGYKASPSFAYMRIPSLV